jgi:hypothetical protein
MYTQKKRSRSRLCSRIGVGIVAALAWTLSAAQVAWPPPAAVQQRLSDAVGITDAVQAILPSPIEDVEGLADRLDFDIEAAIAYARDNLRFEPYLGVLRGPDGTALTTAGNAWDQALLLAALVKTMGADAQIVTGTLSQDDAKRLLLRAFDPPAGEPDTYDSEALVDAVAAFDPDLADALTQRMEERIAQRESASSSSLLEADTAAISDVLTSLLEGADLLPPTGGSADDLIASLAADYAWVRWRDGPGMEWSDLHPAFAGTQAPDVSPERYFDEEVPTEHQHRVAVRLWIERSTGAGSEPERVPVMDSFERPTAQLFRQPLALGMAPVPSVEDDAQGLLVPVLNHALAPGAEAVSGLGLTVSADAVGSSASALFETLSSRLAGGLGALGEAGGGQDESPRLTGIIMTIEQSAPGIESVVLERRVVDLRQREDAVLPDAGVFELLLETDIGAENRTNTIHNFLAQEKSLLQAMPAFYAFARGALSADELQATEQFRALNQNAWLDWDLLSTSFVPDTILDEVAFRPGPMLASRRRVSGDDNEPVTIVDIHTNPVVVLRHRGGGAVSVDSGSAMQQGVRDTLLESTLLPVESGWAERPPNRVIADAAALAADEEARLWPPSALEMANDHLSNGYVLAVVDQQKPHWWRVHRITGETLGMGQYGGQEVAEYIVTSIMVGVAVYIFKESVESCDKRYPDNQQMADCCIFGNLLATYGSAAAGGAAAGYATATGIASLADDMAVHFIEAPWAAATGYVMASLSLDIPRELIVDGIMQYPIARACAAWTDYPE